MRVGRFWPSWSCWCSGTRRPRTRTT